MAKIAKFRRALVALFTLLLIAAGVRTVSATGLSIRTTTSPSGWSYSVIGKCPEGYSLKTSPEAKSGGWRPQDSGIYVSAKCVQDADPSIECWYTREWIANPGFHTPPGTPKPGDPRWTASPTPDCPACRVTPGTATSTIVPTNTQGPPTATNQPGQPSVTPDQPTAAATNTPTLAPTNTATQVAIDLSTATPVPCTSGRTVHENGVDRIICDEVPQDVPEPAGSVVGICRADGPLSYADFTISVIEGEVAEIKYEYSDGTVETAFSQPWSHDQVRAKVPSSALTRLVPDGQSIVAHVVIVGYNKPLPLTSNVVGNCGEKSSPQTPEVPAGSPTPTATPKIPGTSGTSDGGSSLGLILFALGAILALGAFGFDHLRKARGQ